MPVVPFIPAIIGGAATIYGASQANKGQQQAAQASQQASEAAIAEQRRQFDLSRQDQLPWLQTGTAALGQLRTLYGLGGGTGAGTGAGTQTPTTPTGPTNPGGQIVIPGSGSRFDDPRDVTQRPMAYITDDASSRGVRPAAPGSAVAQAAANYQGQAGQPTATTTPAPATGYNAMTGAAPPQGASGMPGQYNSFWMSPDYQIAQNEAQRTLTARNSALGIQDSGAAQRASLQAGAEIASQTYNTYANRIAALAGVGQTAASNLGSLGANFAGQVGSIGMANAQNQATSYVNRGNQNAQTAGQIGGLLGSVAGNLIGGRAAAPTAPGGSLWGLF